MNAQSSSQQRLSGGSVSGLTNNTILRGIGSAITNINYDNIDFVYIIYNIEYEFYNFEKDIINKYSNVKFKFLKSLSIH